VTVAILTDERFLLHDAGPGHPERAERLALAMDDVRRSPVRGTVALPCEPASLEDVLRVHDPAYVDLLRATAGRPRVRLDPDTSTSPRSFEVAMLAAGAAIGATLAVTRAGHRGAFATVRPPGHHARPGAAMGFCLLNNVAIAAEHALTNGLARRVLILDPDVHHGNGTQETFWERDDVLYVSTHQWPLYPGTGAVEEIGEGAGRGFTVNLPLPRGSGDADLVHVHEAVVGPIVDAWRPDLFLVSAGFDTWHRDPLGGMRVTERGYDALFGLFRRWADAHAPGRIAFVLEGGYDADGVGAGVRAALEAMAAETAPLPVTLDDPSPAAVTVAREARSVRDGARVA
jgi:acetoin utilization deacetylase AcuC-like enzyme